MGKPAVVLLSGGLDSTTVLAIAKDQGFEPSALSNNLHALLADLMKAKPASSKGIFLQKVSVSSTMGLGITLDQASLPV